MLFFIAVFAPAIGALVAGLAGRKLGDKFSQVITISLMFLAMSAAIVSLLNFVGGGAPVTVLPVIPWLSVGGFHAEWALRYDTLSVVMVAMVTVISSFVHLYSTGYMSHDKRTWRFFCYLSFFTFSMLILATSNNLVQLFFGWEGVGLFSYLLIGYWYEKPAACAAAIKAFVMNRVGDLAFIVGIALIYFQFHTVTFSGIFAEVPANANAVYHLFGFGVQLPVLEVIGILLFIGAMGKSAQIGLHTWLADAMEGPTPVSALIHAATMVTAGVFLMARMSPLLAYAPIARDVILVVGGTTALFAATIGCVQNDIKKIIAYSTCSQLGYMFLAIGTGFYQGAIFHLITHAFFKSLLFLAAGSVIFILAEEQDIWKMGGLWKKIPFTYVIMWIGCLALGGIPPFSGYWSKDPIILSGAALGTALGTYGYVVGTLAAFLTAFYSWRMLIVAFHGKSRLPKEVEKNIHESPWTMLLPMAVIGTGALIAGGIFKGYFIGAQWQSFWRGDLATGSMTYILAHSADVSVYAHYAPMALAFLGAFTAYWFYMFQPSVPAKLVKLFPRTHMFLVKKWYFDEVYAFLFVRPAYALARGLWKFVDILIIDGIPNSVAFVTQKSANGISKWQTGSVANYAFVMLLGTFILVTIVFIVR